MTVPENISADYTLRPSELAAVLALLVEARQPCILWGPPGYWNRFLGAYGHRRSSARTPRSYVEDQVPGTCIGGPRFRGFPLA